MLTYLINVTTDLLAVSVVIGAILAFYDYYFGDRSHLITRAGLLIGFIIAAVRAYITNTRRLVGGWRVGAYGYGITLAIFVLLAIAMVVLFRSYRKNPSETRKKNITEILLSSLAALMIAGYLYGAVPNVYAYPFKFDSGGNGILSTDYLFRLGGYLLGILVSLLAAVSSYKLLTIAGRKGHEKLLTLSTIYMVLVYGVYIFARLMLVLTPRKIVNSPALFRFAAASNNNSHYYTYAVFACLVLVAVILWVRSFTAKEPYNTPAEHRKQRALWRSARRYSGLMALCCICAVLCATWFVTLNTVVIREAPVEEPLIVKGEDGSDSEIRVPIEMVSDGHLHRFGYTTDEGYLVRIIVVLKQENTNNYGVGLDACDICGVAGYFENNEGEVVCKKCNVVMNRMTIGMKGGCNPIIIDYDINESYISVPVTELVNNQTRFKE